MFRGNLLSYVSLGVGFKDRKKIAVVLMVKILFTSLRPWLHNMKQIYPLIRENCNNAVECKFYCYSNCKSTLIIDSFVKTVVYWDWILVQ